jgi:hypothetical protein
MKRSGMPRPDAEKLRLWRARSKRINPISAKRAAGTSDRAAEREAAFDRDGWLCRLASTYAQSGPCFGVLTPHHLVKASQGGPYQRENLVALCAYHNGWVEDHPTQARALGLVR